jgi:hypothetical protein
MRRGNRLRAHAVIADSAASAKHRSIASTPRGPRSYPCKEVEFGELKMDALIHRQAKRKPLRLTRVELARMFWRAAYYVRRQRPRDEYTRDLLAYLEREFRTMWQRRNAGYRD